MPRQKQRIASAQVCTNGSMARAASAAVRMLVTPLPCRTVGVTTMMAPGHHLWEEHAGDGINAHIADKPPVDAGPTVFAEQVRLSLLFRFLRGLPKEHVGRNGRPQHPCDHEEEIEFDVRGCAGIFSRR